MLVGVWAQKPNLVGASVYAVTYSVNMSEGLSSVLILCTDCIPLCTSCCRNRYFRSMCFAFFDDPILFIMCLPPVESVFMGSCNLSATTDCVPNPK